MTALTEKFINQRLQKSNSRKIFIVGSYIYFRGILQLLSTPQCNWGSSMGQEGSEPKPRARRGLYRYEFSLDTVPPRVKSNSIPDKCPQLA
jgi:hypothetical protein